MNTWNPAEFQTTSKRYRPKMRWWLPGAFMDKDEIKREIRWMAEAGYGGAEIGKKTNFTDEFEGEG